MTPDEEVDLSGYATIEQLNEKSDASHKHTMDDINNLQTSLDGLLEIARSYTDTKVGELENEDNVTQEDLDALSEEYHSYVDSNIGTIREDFQNADSDILTALDTKVSISTTINEKPLSSNIVLSAADVGADVSGSANTALENAKTYADTLASGKADISHTHNDIYYTETEIDEKIAMINESISNLDSTTIIDNKITTHNTSDSAHSDIRGLIDELSIKLNAFLDVDDETTDQLSEVLTLIEQNKDTLESLTNKVNVSDIVDNLTTADTSKVLSANQGVVIQSLIDELQTVVNNKAETKHSHSISDVTNLQSILDEKQTTINGAASTITSSNLDSDKVLVSSDAGKVVTSNITNTELNYLSGVTGNIQAQFNNLNTDVSGKANAAHTHTSDEVTDLQSKLDNINSEIDTITSTYETKTDANTKLAEAKTYADGIKSDLLNGAGGAYDTLKELGDLIDDNTDAIDALEIVASGKADVDHNHDNVYYTEIEVDTLLSGKSDTSHNHDSDYDEKGSASAAVNTHNASTSAHSDIRESISSLQTIVSGKADSIHAHTISEIDNLQVQLDGKSNTSHTHDEYMATVNPVGTGSFSINRLTDSTVGNYSSTFGHNCTASGNYSYAEGFRAVADGVYSHAEGKSTTASGGASHAEGTSTTASGAHSHAEGSNTIASGNYSHAGGALTTASGDYSHAEGYSTVAVGTSSHAEGYSTIAGGMTDENVYYGGDYSHAEGYSTVAVGASSHAEGTSTTASGDSSHAEGSNTIADGAFSHAEGNSTTASGFASHAAGYHTTANDYQYVVGKYNATRTAPTAEGQDTTYEDGIFIVGNGTADDESSRTNALRVSSGGRCYSGRFVAGTADFAELFEWSDGNPKDEDRRGLFVALDGEKIKLAGADDDYFGVVSGTPAFIGNSASEEWHDKYLTDVFGTRLSQEVEIPEKIDEETGEVLVSSYTVTQFIINPEYNPNETYVMRENRKEWDTIGLCGQVVVVDDGTCIVGGYCKPSHDGIGTVADNGYRVMKRIDENHIKVLVK